VTDPDGAAASERAAVTPLRQEPVQVLIAVAAGVLLSTVLVGARAGVALWRLAILPVALLFVVRGIVGLIGLGRSEWRRERTGARAYLAVVLRFVLAYLLVVAAVAA
jgi:hypothetical protein